MPSKAAVLGLVAFMSFGGIPDLAASPIYFLVAEFPGAEVVGDSYALPVETPEDIAHARDLIAQGPGIGRTIAVASIAAGADGINRDFRAPGTPLWSWHLTEFIGFADVTAEILDGSPTLVENDVREWIANTGGRIGFWSYTVVSELGALPVPAPPTSILLLSGLAGLRWVRRGRPARGVGIRRETAVAIDEAAR